MIQAPPPMHRARTISRLRTAFAPAAALALSLSLPSCVAGDSTTDVGEGAPSASSVVSAAAAPLLLELSIRIVLGDVRNAGTDDDVYVRINGGPKFYLDYQRNDFERASDNVYHLPVTVANVDELDYITLGKEGDDGLCVRHYQVMVNARVAWATASLSEPGSPCLWLDNDATHERAFPIYRSPNVSYAALRASTAQYTLTMASMRSQWEANLGHALHFTRLDPWRESRAAWWSNRPVTLTYNPNGGHFHYTRSVTLNAYSCCSDDELVLRWNLLSNPCESPGGQNWTMQNTPYTFWPSDMADNWMANMNFRFHDMANWDAICSRQHEIAPTGDIVVRASP